MNTRTWLNLGLALLLLSLALFAYFEPGHEQPPGVRLTGLTPNQIKNIAIERAGVVIALVHAQDGWQVTSPIHVAANKFRIDAVLSLLQASSYKQFPAGGRDLHAYGLDRPLLRVHLGDTNIAFGGTEPLEGRRYALVGTTIHLISDTYYADLDAGLAGYVARNLVPPGAHIIGVDLPDHQLRRGAGGHWSVTPGTGSADAVAALVERWTHGEALRVAAYTNTAADVGDVVLHLEGGPAPTLHYRIVTRTPELILARPDIGMQFHLNAEEGAHLLNIEAPPAAPNSNPP